MTARRFHSQGGIHKLILLVILQIGDAVLVEAKRLRHH